MMFVKKKIELNLFCILEYPCLALQCDKFIYMSFICFTREKCLQINFSNRNFHYFWTYFGSFDWILQFSAPSHLTGLELKSPRNWDACYYTHIKLKALLREKKIDQCILVLQNRQLKNHQTKNEQLRHNFFQILWKRSRCNILVS